MPEAICTGARVKAAGRGRPYAAVPNQQKKSPPSFEGGLNPIQGELEETGTTISGLPLAVVFIVVMTDIM
jgi:hypothetical protein